MQAQFIGDHGDELAVGGLAPGVVDGIAEVGVQHVHVAPVPSHFNGVANGTFHPGTGGVVLFGHIGVSCLVTALIISGSSTAIKMESRR